VLADASTGKCPGSLAWISHGAREGHGAVFAVQMQCFRSNVSVAVQRLIRAVYLSGCSLLLMLWSTGLPTCYENVHSLRKLCQTNAVYCPCYRPFYYLYGSILSRQKQVKEFTLSHSLQTSGNGQFLHKVDSSLLETFNVPFSS